MKGTLLAIFLVLLLGTSVRSANQDADQAVGTGSDQELVNSSLPLASTFPNLTPDQIITTANANNNDIDTEVANFELNTRLVIGNADTVEDIWSANIRSAATFEELFNLIVSHLNERISQLQTIRTQRGEVCQTYFEQQDNLTHTTEEIQHYIDWIATKIQEQDQQIERIFDDRCDAHLSYINFQKNSKITLRLLEFLKRSVQDYSLLQLRSVGKILVNYMNIKLSNEEAVKQMLVELKQVDQAAYDAGHSLDQAERERSGEEIGTGHIDDNRDQIQVGNFQNSERRLLGSYKDEILEIIDNLISNITQQQERRTNDEIDLNERVIQWTTNVQIEIQNLQRESQSSNDQIEELENELQVNEYWVETCNAEMGWVQDQITGTSDYKQTLIDNEAAFRERYEIQRQIIQDTENLPVVDPESASIDITNQTP